MEGLFWNLKPLPSSKGIDRKLSLDFKPLNDVTFLYFYSRIIHTTKPGKILLHKNTIT